MKVYVAAPWENRESANEWASTLEAQGFEITRKWWEHEAGDEEFDVLREQAVADLDAVADADAVLVLQISRSEGKAAETGAAIAFGIPVIALLFDKPGNIFHRHPGVLMTHTAESAIGALKAIRAFACED
jgi:nucleoside 2-deoxyribosyltransferase